MGSGHATVDHGPVANRIFMASSHDIFSPGLHICVSRGRYVYVGGLFLEISFKDTKSPPSDDGFQIKKMRNCLNKGNSIATPISLIGESHATAFLFQSINAFI